MNLDLTGANVLLVTPFRDDKSLDLVSLARLIDHVIDGGATGVIVLGSTGEFFGLTHDEKLSVISAAADFVAGRVPLTIGVGSDGTAESVALALAAQANHSDCLMVTPPLYFDSSASAQVEHYTTIASRTDLPVMLYDGSNGIRVPLEVVREAHRYSPNIRYIKIAAQEPALFRRFADHLPNVIAIIGDDMMLLQGLRAGGSGSATAIGNVLPTRIAALHRAFLVGDNITAFRVATELAPFTMRASIPKNQFIAKFKVLLRELGIIASDTVRPPLTALTNVELEELRSDLLPVALDALSPETA